MRWGVGGNKNFSLNFLRCKNKNLERIMLCISIAAVLLEAMVKTPSSCFIEKCLRTVIEVLSDGNRTFPIELSSDYPNEVFSATCTVAVLGNAILSLLFGVYDKKTLGVPFQDVLNHSLIGDEQKYTIQALSVSILFAILWYVFECYNLLFSVLIQDVFLLLFSCDDLWRFLSDKDTQKKTITEIVKKVDPSKYAVYVDNWFKELDGALVPNNGDEAQQYCDLIELVMEFSPESEGQIRSCVGRHIQEYFNSACDKLGFVEAFDLLRRVLKYAPEDYFAETQIALKYLEKLKIKDQVDIVNSEVTDLVQEIFCDKQFCEEDKIFYAYHYFCAVFDNVQMNSAVKDKQIDRILRYLCDMIEEEYGKIKAKVIMNIAKHGILYNDNLSSRKRLFCALIESLQKRRHYCSDEYYLATICEIYRAFFFVTNLEYGSLTDDYRRELISLFHTSTDEKDMASLSFMTLILDRAEDVVFWFAQNAVSSPERPNTFWEYHGLATNWKRVVWTKEAITLFAFSIYHLLESCCADHPFVSIMESVEYTEQEKIALCKTLLEQYNGIGYSEEMMQIVQRVAEFSNIRVPTVDSFWKQERSYFQEKLIAMESSTNQSYYENAKLKNEEIWKEVQKEFGGNELFVFDSSFSLFPGSRITLDTEYVVLYQNFWKGVSKRVSHKISCELSAYLVKILPQITINCSAVGINKLLEILTVGNYRFRTFRSMEKYKFGLELRNTPNYKQLITVLESIPYASNSQIREKILLKKKRIPVNFYLQYELRTLTPEECVSYVHNHGEDDVYSINGNRFDYDHALEYASKNVLAENVAIFVHVGIEADEGFRLRLE